MDSIRYHELLAFFQGAAEVFAEKKEELCEMDTRMGDGDLGLTMEKGFGAPPRLAHESGEDGSIRKTLMRAGMRMPDLVPSAMGTLMANGTVKGAKILGGGAEMGPKEFSESLDGFAREIGRRRGCRSDNRTFLDTADAVAKRALEASGDKADMVTIVHVAVGGARASVAAAKDMLPRFDRATVFSVRVKGISDQGAVTEQYLLEGTERYSLS